MKEESEMSQSKRAWPIRFLIYILLKIYLFFAYFVYAIVQLDLWILTKRKGPIPQAVRILVVTLGFFFLLGAYLACNGDNFKCGPPDVQIAPESSLNQKEIEKIIKTSHEKLSTQGSEIVEALLKSQSKETVQEMRTIFDKMLVSYSSSFRNHEQALEDQKTASVNLIKKGISASLDEKGLLSASQFNDLKDLYLPQIHENIKSAREKISEKLDKFSETSTELLEYGEITSKSMLHYTASIEDRALELEKKMKAFESQFVVTQEEIVSLIHAVCDEKLKEFSLDELTEDKLLEIVKKEVYLYTADQIGLPDYALASAGGFVENVEALIPINADTDVVFTNNLTQIKEKLPAQYKKILELPVTESSGSWLARLSPKDSTKDLAQVILSPDNHIGNCWPFIGNKANVTIRLACQVKITSISIDHAHPKIDHMHGKTALNEFSVYGMDEANKAQKLLDGSYSISERPPQQFMLQTPQGPFKRIWLEIKSNHGALYTCLYRVRVHSATGCDVN